MTTEGDAPTNQPGGTSASSPIQDDQDETDHKPTTTDREETTEDEEETTGKHEPDHKPSSVSTDTTLTPPTLNEPPEYLESQYTHHFLSMVTFWFRPQI